MEGEDLGSLWYFTWEGQLRACADQDRGCISNDYGRDVDELPTIMTDRTVTAAAALQQMFLPRFKQCWQDVKRRTRCCPPHLFNRLPKDERPHLREFDDFYVLARRNSCGVRGSGTDWTAELHPSRATKAPGELVHFLARNPIATVAAATRSGRDGCRPQGRQK
jgi:hypothetical protein